MRSAIIELELWRLDILVNGCTADNHIVRCHYTGHFTICTQDNGSLCFLICMMETELRCWNL